MGVQRAFGTERSDLFSLFEGCRVSAIAQRSPHHAADARSELECSTQSARVVGRTRVTGHDCGNQSSARTRTLQSGTRTMAAVSPELITERSEGTYQREVPFSG